MSMLNIIYILVLMLNMIGAYFAEEYVSFGFFLLVSFTGILSLSRNRILMGLHIFMLIVLMVYSIIFAVLFVEPSIAKEKWEDAILRLGIALGATLSFLFTTAVFVFGLFKQFKTIKESGSSVE